MQSAAVLPQGRSVTPFPALQYGIYGDKEGVRHWALALSRYLALQRLGCLALDHLDDQCVLCC